MKRMCAIAGSAVLCVAAPGPCFALWGIVDVSGEEAKEMGMEIRWAAGGPNHVTVELGFEVARALKHFSRVDLRIGGGEDSAVIAPLREDRSKPGRVVVRFTADRARLDELSLWVMVPGELGGTIYQLRVGDFVEGKEDR